MNAQLTGNEVGGAGTRSFLPSVVIAVAVLVVAFVAGAATDVRSEWYLQLEKPTWQPPGSVFGAVWTAIYISIAASAIMGYRCERSERRNLMILFAINGLLNMAWSYLFFSAENPLMAGIELIMLWTTIAALCARLWPVSRTASILLVPYFLWVSFAVVLNWDIASRNGY